MGKRKFYCYLDSFEQITIIIPNRFYQADWVYKLIGNNEIINLVIDEILNIGDETKLTCSFDAYINLELVYEVTNNLGDTSELYTGKIVRTDLFDSIYYYRKNDLGITYTNKATKFKIWSPVAKGCKIELVAPDGVVIFRNMFYKNQGVWRIEILGDLEGYMYRFHVYVNGKTKITTDPYGLSSTANAKYNYVVDLAKTYQMKNDSINIINQLDTIIYEVNVRDFTSKLKIDHSGQYLGFITKGLTTKEGRKIGFDYLKQLGITHVQLMPVFDFGGVDEINPDKYYNWGYNPEQYNVPEGWFSSNPHDPYVRINELKMMIDEIHEAGLGVTMDVVYNHVYNMNIFPFEKLCPGYAYRVDREQICTNVSGCDNDLNSSKKMIRKFIVDSVLYWAREYRFDGFRFDLMGLIDFETINDVKLELQNLNKNYLVYGEGWKMYSYNTADLMAHMYNKNIVSSVFFFNDKFREFVKGSTFNLLEKGYSLGNNQNLALVREVLLGSANNRYLFKYASQSLNYVECHDNCTFFDKASAIFFDELEVKERQKLATSMVILAQGVPFIHSGQEFYRTKKGVENSYKSSDEINGIDWSLIDKHAEDIEYIKKVLNFRTKHIGFKNITSDEIAKFVSVNYNELGTIFYRLTKIDDILIIFKNNDDKEMINIDKNYNLVIAANNGIEYKEGFINLSSIGTYIFMKEE